MRGLRTFVMISLYDYIVMVLLMIAILWWSFDDAIFGNYMVL